MAFGVLSSKSNDVRNTSGLGLFEKNQTRQERCVILFSCLAGLSALQIGRKRQEISQEQTGLERTQRSVGREGPALTRPVLTQGRSDALLLWGLHTPHTSHSTSPMPSTI